jgi:DNA-binding MarR family transcriptional regulator
MGKYWNDDDFIRKDARNLSAYAQSVYHALACHANKSGETFIGYRKIGTELGIDKNTVNRAVNDLIAYGRVRRLEKKYGRASFLKIIPVLSDDEEPYYRTIHKEDPKEVFKEEKNNFNPTEPEVIGDVIKNQKGLELLRNKMKEIKK